MDLERNLKLALSTGKVYFGAEQAEKAVKKGEAKTVIRASNANSINLGDVKIIEYKGTAMELGSVCGKPFAISHITVVDGGNSELR